MEGIVQALGSIAKRLDKPIKVVSSAFTQQGAAFTTTSATFVDVTNMSMTYVAGTVDETLILMVTVVGRPSALVSTACTLNNGSDLEPHIVMDNNAVVSNTRGQPYIFNVTANSTTTLKIRGKIAGGATLTLDTNVSALLPQIKGIAIPRVY